MATIVDGKNRIPFMRGMLIHYLIQRGFTHAEAREVANAAREALSKQQDIRKKEIVRLISGLIEKQYSTREVGDLVFWERLPTSVTVERTNGARPFSKEILSHSVQATGLPPDRAYQIAAAIESRLIDQHCQRITDGELEKITVDLLTKHYGEAYAERYRVWRVWGALDKPLVILIGGASGVGKTTLGISLANLLNIPRVVATDDIRQVMRLMLSQELMPALHPSSYAAGEALPEPPAAKDSSAITGYREQARIVNVGVRAIIGRCIEEQTSAIIDGVHLLPDLLDIAAYSQSAFLIPLCLSLSNRQTYEARFTERAATAPRRAQHKYVSHLDAIIQIQEHILQCSTAHNIPIIETSTVDDLTSSAAMIIGESLQDLIEAQKLGNGTRKKKKNA